MITEILCALVGESLLLQHAAVSDVVGLINNN